MAILHHYTIAYWLRPIERGKSGLANFASHFIRVQIFQIDFPLKTKSISNGPGKATSVGVLEF